MGFSMRQILPVMAALCMGTAHAAEPVTRSAKSGPWSAPETWDTKAVPAAGARVLIRQGHHVTYDTKSPEVIRGICVSGVLNFNPDKDTELNVGLIKVQPGDEYSEDGFDCDMQHPGRSPGSAEGETALLIGVPGKPIAKFAKIRLHHVTGMNKESCPAIVCCGGRWESHGQPMNRAWVKLGANAGRGDTTLSLAEPVTGWKAGDRVVITGSQVHGAANGRSEAEERIISSVDGSSLKLAEPLGMSHLGEGDYRAEVANLSRNIVVESADPAGIRGHTMYHNGSSGSLTHTEFRHLGKKDTLGRYALHFHLCRDTMRGSAVVGNSIWDSHNRWLTIHGTDYLVARDNVGYQSIGHGFFLEDGTETFNVLDRNLAIGAKPGKRLPKQVLPFDGNEGAGFWWTCSLNSFTRNVAAECGNYGFRYEATPTSALKLMFPIRQPDGTTKPMDPRTLPFVRFDDNEAHSSHGLYGVNLGEGVARVGPDAAHSFVVRNLRIWDVHYAFRAQVPNLRVSNLAIHKAAYGIYHPHFDGWYLSNVLISQTNTEPFNRGHDDLSIQYGTLVVDGITFDSCRSGGMPLIQISDDNPTGSASSHFRGVSIVNWNDNSRQKAVVNLGGGPRPTPKTPKGVPVYLHDWNATGKTMVVVSVKSGEFKAEPGRFAAVAGLTGDESRAAEAKDAAFPAAPALVDDLPPATVVTSVTRQGSRVRVAGISTDNNSVGHVAVSLSAGSSIRKVAAEVNGIDWVAEWDDAPLGTLIIEAVGKDMAGNLEKTPATVRLPSAR